MAEKRKRISRNVKNLIKIETVELKMETKMKVELSEIRQKLRRYQREGSKPATSLAPEGWRRSKGRDQDGHSTLMEIQHRKGRETED